MPHRGESIASLSSEHARAVPIARQGCRTLRACRFPRPSSMRSKLFVPGGRPELFAKALAGEADALSLDLEDSVTPELKGAARTAIASFLATEAARQSPKLMIVRTNAPSTPYFADDIEAVVGDGVTLINLPKIESAEEV